MVSQKTQKLLCEVWSVSISWWSVWLSGLSVEQGTQCERDLSVQLWTQCQIIFCQYILNDGDVALLGVSQWVETRRRVNQWVERRQRRGGLISGSYLHPMGIWWGTTSAQTLSQSSRYMVEGRWSVWACSSPSREAPVGKEFLPVEDINNIIGIED